MPITTLNPTYDGRIQSNPGSTDWATVRDAASGTAINTATSPVGSATSGKLVTSGNFLINRGYYIFTKPAGTITALKLRLYVTAKINGDNDAADTIDVYDFNPADPESVATADFDQFGTTSFSTPIDIGSISTSAYSEWDITNASHIASLISGDYICIGIREGHDATNAAYAGSNDTFNEISVEQSEGASNKPELIVTTSSSGALFFAQY